MTRAEIRRNVLLRLAEAPEEGREPLYLGEAIRMAADEVAVRTDCYQTHYTMDINGSPTELEEFCLPGELYKIKAAKVIHSDDTVSILSPLRGEFVTRNWMDRHYYGWQDPTMETGNVRYLVLERPKALLYPFPAYDKTGGLVLYGYAKPGDAWTASAAAETDECPLPEYAHTAVEIKAALIRAMQFPTPDNKYRIPLLQDEYEREVGRVARLAGQETSTASMYVGGGN